MRNCNTASIDSARLEAGRPVQFSPFQLPLGVFLYILWFFPSQIALVYPTFSTSFNVVVIGRKSDFPDNMTNRPPVLNSAVENRNIYMCVFR